LNHWFQGRGYRADRRGACNYRPATLPYHWAHEPGPLAELTQDGAYNLVDEGARDVILKVCGEPAAVVVVAVGVVVRVANEP
jgi:hypothetical protein